MHYAQLSSVGYTDALTAEGDDDIKVGDGGFEDNGETGLSLAHCIMKKVAFEIVHGAESPSKAWSRLVQHYHASGLKEQRRVTVNFYAINMSELERVERPMDPNDDEIVILSGITSQYDAEVWMLESSSDWPSREWIERAVIN